jgi:hypothetical protein
MRAWPVRLLCSLRSGWLASGLLLLCLSTCSRPPTLRVQVTSLPTLSRSLAISLVQQGSSGELLAATMESLPPYDLPQPTPDQTDFVLRLWLPMATEPTLRLGVAAFSQAGGSGCVLGLGQTALPFTGSPLDETVTVSLAEQSDPAQPACASGPRIIAVSPASLSIRGGETLVVTGWGFQPGARLVLNGVALETRYVSAGQLEATSPSAPRFAEARLQVELPDGTSLRHTGLRYLASQIGFAQQAVLPIDDVEYALDVADLDGDQRPDLLFYPTPYSSTPKTLVAYQRSPLTFTVEQLPTLTSGLRGLMAIDLDLDGDTDLVTLGLMGRTIRVLKNDGLANFSVQSYTLAAGLEARSFACVDLDGDRAPELILLTAGGTPAQALRTLRNPGSGDFDLALATVTNLDSLPMADTLLGADYDLNGQPDLWIVTASEIHVLQNPGATPPANPQNMALLEVDDLGSPRLVKDFDGDKHPDVLGEGFDTTVLLSGSNPRWTPRIFRKACPANAYAFADLDGDDLPDAASACYSTSEVRFSLQRATSQRFTSDNKAPAMPLPMGTDAVYQMQFHDVDGDGRPDLILSADTSSGPSLANYHVFRNISQ